jgi:hypothetical protein
MLRSLYLASFVTLIALGSVFRAQGKAIVDTTFNITTERVEDTVTVTILWHRKEKDKVEVRLDVLDMSGTLVKSYRDRAKVGNQLGAQVRFVLNPHRELELDTATYYYAISANVSCQCEELLRAFLPYNLGSYTLPDPKLKVRISKHNRKNYVALVAENLALGVHITFPQNHPNWHAETNNFDLLPGQDMEVEIEGVAPGEQVLVQEVTISHIK